jgi:hypothetical protein
MPKGPKGKKRPADVIGNAVHVMRIATGEVENKAPPRGTKKKIAADLATVDADERVLLITRKVQEARTARRKGSSQGRRSTKGK